MHPTWLASFPGLPPQLNEAGRSGNEAMTLTDVENPMENRMCMCCMTRDLAGRQGLSLSLHIMPLYITQLEQDDDTDDMDRA